MSVERNVVRTKHDRIMDVIMRNFRNKYVWNAYRKLHMPCIMEVEKSLWASIL